MTTKQKLALKIITTVSVFFVFSFILQKIFNISLEELEMYVASYGPIAPLVYSLLLLLGLTVPFNPISDFVVVIAAGFLFPPILAIPATFAAHTLAISINYFVGKKFGWRLLNLIAKESEMEYLNKLTRRITPLEVFALRWILPLTAIGIDIVGFSSGMAKLNFFKYFVASIIPWTTLSIVYFISASYLKEVSTILYFLPSIGLIIVSLVIYKFLDTKIKK